MSTSREAAGKSGVKAGWELPAVTDPEVIALYLPPLRRKSKAAVFESLQYLVTPPVVEQFAELSDIIGRYLGEARDGFLTPQEALDMAQMEAEARIA